jgi:hypothetical protein
MRVVFGKEEKASVAECVEIEEDEDAVVLRRLTSHIPHQLSGLSLTSKSL